MFYLLGINTTNKETLVLFIGRIEMFELSIQVEVRHSSSGRYLPDFLLEVGNPPSEVCLNIGQILSPFHLS